MTKMIIDNRATAKKRFECYTVDRNEYKTIEDLKTVAYEFLNKDVYSITVTENDIILFRILNTVA